MDQTEEKQERGGKQKLEKQVEELRWEHEALEQFRREVDSLRVIAVEKKMMFDYGINAGLDSDAASQFADQQGLSKSSLADALTTFVCSQDGFTLTDLGFSRSFCEKYQSQIDSGEDIKEWAATFAVKEAESKQGSSEAEE